MHLKIGMQANRDEKYLSQVGLFSHLNPPGMNTISLR